MAFDDNGGGNGADYGGGAYDQPKVQYDDDEFQRWKQQKEKQEAGADYDRGDYGGGYADTDNKYNNDWYTNYQSMKQEEYKDKSEDEKQLNREKFQSFYGGFDDNIVNNQPNFDFAFDKQDNDEAKQNVQANNDNFIAMDGNSDFLDMFKNLYVSDPTTQQQPSQQPSQQQTNQTTDLISFDFGFD